MTTKRSLHAAAALLVLGAGLMACAKKAPPPAPPQVTSQTTTGKDSIRRTQTVTIQARVVAINQKTREVTLRGHDGKEVTFKVDPAVKNLPQVKKGDDVTATYYQSLAIHVRKPGSAKPGVTGAEDLITAAPGSMPGAATASTVEIVATVTKVDKANSEITLKGPKGKTVTVAVQDPANLDKVKKGDLLQIAYTEAVAIAVEKPSH